MARPDRSRTVRPVRRRGGERSARARAPCSGLSTPAVAGIAVAVAAVLIVSGVGLGILLTSFRKRAVATTDQNPLLPAKVAAQYGATGASTPAVGLTVEPTHT